MRIDKFSKWLKGAAPVLHRALRWPWQYIEPYVPIENTYWGERKDFRYYEEVVRFARHHVPQGGRVIDVGAGATKLLERMTWFDERARARSIRDSLTTRHRANPPGLLSSTVRCTTSTSCSASRFSSTSTIQAPSLESCLPLAATVIISVPYKWPKGAHPPHVQDPVDEAKLEAWTGRKPAETCIVHDGADRLIAVYRGPFTP